MARKLIDLTGQRFGRWTVICREGSYNSGNHSIPTWLCRCDCGRFGVVTGNNLRSGASISCGCYRSEAVSSTQKYRHAKEKYGRVMIYG